MRAAAITLADTSSTVLRARNLASVHSTVVYHCIVMVRSGSYLTSGSSSSVPSMARVAATVVASCGLSREEECEMKTRTV